MNTDSRMIDMVQDVRMLHYPRYFDLIRSDDMTDMLRVLGVDSSSSLKNTSFRCNKQM
jgi:hypothetical protein